MSEHTPVLKDEILEFFQDIEIKTFIDGTLGAGGHARALLTAHPEISAYLGIDQDKEAILLARQALEEWKDKLKVLNGNFSTELLKLKDEGVQADGILLDLGVSSMQLDRKEKGFSFRFDTPLDMRMDTESPLTAEEVVNTYDEQQLFRIFKDYGEEPKAFRIARAICKAREKEPIKTTGPLVRLIENIAREDKKKRIHPATLVFQALRIEVNQELEVLKKALPLALSLLKQGGILAVISFHSLEDRIVKQFFQNEAMDKESTRGIGGLFIDKDPTLKLLSRKPVTASDEELDQNPRSRINWLEKLRWGEEQIEDIRNAAYAYIRQGKYDIALPFFEALVILDPETAYNAQTLGALHLQLGHAKEAIRAFDMALKLDADHAPTLLNLAKALFMLGKRDEGLKLANILKNENEAAIANGAKALIMAYDPDFAF